MRDVRTDQHGRSDPDLCSTLEWRHDEGQLVMTRCANYRLYKLLRSATGDRPARVGPARAHVQPSVAAHRGLYGGGRKVDTGAQQGGNALGLRETKHGSNWTLREVCTDEERAAHVVRGDCGDIGGNRRCNRWDVARHCHDRSAGFGDARVRREKAIGVRGGVNRRWETEISLPSGPFGRDD